ncbi:MULTISPECIES: molybdate ABC transporter substrate-binding protein [unclassified Clostridium]|uniref:molybdate ABC transporter substrate-binding protein n=1 Tax=unclassified Clostridium TaxID=2614128 RepID=UPI000297ED41|nr:MULTISPECIES: molybdate ABC transporter substrate-binding protein [unclassified Clostridium]EKQ52817.1 MAG: molybdenum ABC transporter, periplasmic molybdate-binding protein [Clostridium sp. Maddingley MBC34-26]
MKFKKIIWIGAINLIMIALITGCSGIQKSAQVSSNSSKNEISQTDSSEKKRFEGKSLLVYCAAGINNPMEAIGEEFKEKYGADVQFTYANSTELISQMEISKKGDLCILASVEDYQSAKDKNLIKDKKELAKHIPAIAVPKGNPANIKSLKDFGNPGVKVILGDPQVTPLGKLANKLFEKQGILDAAKNNIVSTFSTVNEVVTFLSQGKGDCSIVWEDNILNSSKDLDLISIPENENMIKTIPVCTLQSSSENELAQEFMNFTESDESKEILKKFNLKPIQ